MFEKQSSSPPNVVFWTALAPPYRSFCSRVDRSRLPAQRSVPIDAGTQDEQLLVGRRRRRTDVCRHLDAEAGVADHIVDGDPGMQRLQTSPPIHEVEYAFGRDDVARAPRRKAEPFPKSGCAVAEASGRDVIAALNQHPRPMRRGDQVRLTFTWRDQFFAEVSRNVENWP